MRRLLVIFFLTIHAAAFAQFQNQDKDSDFNNSAFIKIMNKFNNGKVPFPFKSLLDSFGTGVTERGNILFVPKGRSLVKNHSDYKNPRIIVNPLDLNSEAGKNQKVWLEKEKLLSDMGIKKGDIYIGFAPNHTSLEVISFNPKKNKYDFFVIENYEAGKQPKVISNPPLCLSCHQNGAPIFPKFPWTEMLGKTSDGIIERNGAVKNRGKNELMERIIAANPERDNIEGIKIKAGLSRFDSFQTVNFDVSIRDANQSLLSRKQCKLLCANSNNQANCKNLIVKYYKEEILSNEKVKRLADEDMQLDLIFKNFKKNLSAFSMKTSVIPNRNPEITDKLSKAEDPATIREDQERLDQFKKEIKGTEQYKEAFKKMLPECFENENFNQILKSVDEHELKSFLNNKNAQEALTAWPEDRGSLNLLTNLLKKQESIDNNCHDDGSNLLTVFQVDKQIQKVVEETNDKYIKKPNEHFLKYCSQCHGGATSFIPLPLESIKSMSKYPPKFSTVGILERLEKKIMPPEGAPQPTTSERKTMIEALKTAK